MFSMFVNNWLAYFTQDRLDINVNSYNSSPMRFRLAKALQMQLRGKACFDFEYYRHHSPDIPTIESNNALWDKFVEAEQFTGRKFRWLPQ